MERDLVCGMQVDPAKAAGSSQYNGKNYHFCSKGCKAKFDANPLGRRCRARRPQRPHVLLPQSELSRPIPRQS
ncbi:MAG: YHS domain-containing protein [Acidobacteriota bacterium]